MAAGTELPVLALGHVPQHLLVAPAQTVMLSSLASGTGDTRAGRASGTILGDAVRGYESGAGAFVAIDGVGGGRFIGPVVISGEI